MNDTVDDMRKAVSTRLLAVRQKAGISQSAMASTLLISAQAYKNYEHGLRELPLSVAAMVCVEFGVSLDWLVFDQKPELKASSLELVREASTASIDLIGGCSESFSSEKFGKLVAYVFRQSLITGVRPCEIVDSSLNSIIR